MNTYRLINACCLAAVTCRSRPMHGRASRLSRVSSLLALLFISGFTPLARADAEGDFFESNFLTDEFAQSPLLLAASGSSAQPADRRRIPSAEPLTPVRPPPPVPKRPDSVDKAGSNPNSQGSLPSLPRSSDTAVDSGSSFEPPLPSSPGSIDSAGPARPSPARVAQSRIVQDAANAAAPVAGAPRLPGARPLRPPPPPPVVPRPVVVGTNLFAPTENNRLRNSPPGLRMRLQPDAPRVYDAPRVKPFKLNPSAAPDFVYVGKPVRFGKSGEPFLDPNGSLGNPASGTRTPVGKFLGGGANSKVYTSNSDPRVVKKFMWLDGPGGTSAVTDQDAGRAILEDVLVARPNSPFRIVKRIGAPMTIKATQGGQQYNFVLSREENIASEVINDNPGHPKKRLGDRVTVTNAQDRVDARRPRNGRNRLTRAEEMTINLAIRDLNAEGIVWTDHKLANLDVVPDPSAPFGHRVVFFDLDAFRPVRGANRQERLQSARELQQIFDGNLGTNDLRGKLSAFNARRYPDGGGPFDFTAFGGPTEVPGYMYTRSANVGRADYKALNDQPTDAFVTSLSTFASRVAAGT